MIQHRRSLFLVSLFLMVLVVAGGAFATDLSVTDALGRTVSVPQSPERVICSGSGALRLLVYLQAQDRIVAVDSAEDPKNDVRALAARPYSLANPQFSDLPIFGEFRGIDSPELIAGLVPQPQLIFKVSPLSGPHPDVLTEKTGIPVIGLNYGNLTDDRERFYATLRLMGRTLGKEDRANAVIDFFEGTLADLARRTEGIPEGSGPSCYIGGVASRGTHGVTSTEPGYAPFLATRARNVAGGENSGKSEVIHIAKEKLIEWDPDILFIDANTTRSADQANALKQLESDPALSSLTAVREGRIWCVIPYNSYTINYDSVLANCYFVGKVLWPDRFADVDAAKKADEIYAFLVGKPVFQEMQDSFGDILFSRIDLKAR